MNEIKNKDHTEIKERKKEQFHSSHFSFGEVRPDLEEIQFFLQSEQLGDDHPVNLFIREILPSLETNEDIEGGYIIKEVDSLSPKEGIIKIEHTNLIVGSQVCAYLKGASSIALFLCTAGPVFTQLSTKFNQSGDYLEAFIVDAIGSLTVEKAIDRIQEKLEISLMADGLKISNRYSPGYCNWALAEQQTLFGLIGKNPVNISLSESSLMTPIKSVSGVIGIGTNIRKREYGCKICQNTSCIYRKIINKE